MSSYDMQPPGSISGAECQIQTLGDIYLKYFGYRTYGRFVDVGAFNCVHWSNTYPLGRLGWSGILIEPNPHVNGHCYEIYRGRADIHIVEVVVGEAQRLAKLYLGGSLSTTVAEQIPIYNSMEWSRIAGLSEERYIEVPCRRLDHILSHLNWQPGFDLLSIDVEGAELSVLRSLELDIWKPTMIIVECHAKYPNTALSAKAIPIGEHMAQAGYREIYADTINSIFVKKES